MAWYNSIFEEGGDNNAPAIWSRMDSTGTKSNIPYTSLANIANPQMTERPQYKKTFDFLRSAYELGREMWWELRNDAIQTGGYTGVKDEQNEEGEYRADWMESRMWDILYQRSAEVVPYGAYDRWAIFTDLQGWEFDETQWEEALSEATGSESDDREIIPYRILTACAENVILAGYHDKLGFSWD